MHKEHYFPSPGFLVVFFGQSFPPSTSSQLFINSISLTEKGHLGWQMDEAPAQLGGNGNAEQQRQLHGQTDIKENPKPITEQA